MVPDSDIKLYNMKTNAVTNVSVHAGSLQWRPRIWGNRIVWLDGRNGHDWDIWWYDIAAKREYQLTTGATDDMWPEISGDRVVWQKWNGAAKYDIYMYDFKTRRTTQITTNGADQINPRISGNRIIWRDQRIGNWDIYWYDIAEKREYPLTNGTDNEVDADVSGTKATWVRQGAGGHDVWLTSYFDKNGVSAVPSGYGAFQSRPRLSGATWYGSTAAPAATWPPRSRWASSHRCLSSQTGQAVRRSPRYGATLWSGSTRETVAKTSTR